MKKIFSLLILAAPFWCKAQTTETNVAKAYSMVHTYALQKKNAIPQVREFLVQYDTTVFNSSTEARMFVYDFHSSKEYPIHGKPLYCTIDPDMFAINRINVGVGMQNEMLTLGVDSAFAADYPLEVIGGQIVAALTVQYYYMHPDTVGYATDSLREKAFVSAMYAGQKNACIFAKEFVRYQLAGRKPSARIQKYYDDLREAEIYFSDLHLHASR